MVHKEEIRTKSEQFTWEDFWKKSSKESYHREVIIKRTRDIPGLFFLYFVF